MSASKRVSAESVAADLLAVEKQAARLRLQVESDYSVSKKIDDAIARIAESEHKLDLILQRLEMRALLAERLHQAAEDVEEPEASAILRGFAKALEQGTLSINNGRPREIPKRVS